MQKGFRHLLSLRMKCSGVRELIPLFHLLHHPLCGVQTLRDLTDLMTVTDNELTVVCTLDRVATGCLGNQSWLHQVAGDLLPHGHGSTGTLNDVAGTTF